MPYKISNVYFFEKNFFEVDTITHYYSVKNGMLKYKFVLVIKALFV